MVLPGNKNVPEPRLGYEQRKVSHHKYKASEAKGWKQRKDEDGRIYNGFDYILCERSIKPSDSLPIEVKLFNDCQDEFVLPIAKIVEVVTIINNTNETIKIPIASKSKKPSKKLKENLSKLLEKKREDCSPL